MSVKALFYPEPQPSSEWVVGVKRHENQDGPLQVDWEPEWPESATHANILGNPVEGERDSGLKPNTIPL